MADASLIHTLRGRARFRVPALDRRAHLAATVEAWLRDQPGLTEAAVNPTCRSITLWYDPARWSPDELRHLVSALPYDQIEQIERLEEARWARRPAAPAEGFADDLFGPALWSASVGMLVALVAEPAALPFLVVGAWPLLSRAYDSLTQAGLVNVDVLDASAATLLALQGNLAMATVMVWLINVAGAIRAAAMERSVTVIADVLSDGTHEAWVVRDDRRRRVKVSEVGIGETVVVYPGERITVDGTVIAGNALVDHTALTGESTPIETGEGDAVYAATAVREGKLSIRVERVAAETEAARILRLVQARPTRETRMQRETEEWANSLVPYSFLGAGLAAGLGGGLEGATSVLIVDYATGIRIAAPTAVLASMAKAARHGILVKGGRPLEDLAEADAMVFALTGALTSGRLEVRRILQLNDMTEDQVLALAAGAEQRLTHPLAHAIARASATRGLTVPERTASDYTLGLGVEASLAGATVLVGSPRYLALKGLSLSRKVHREIRDIEEQAVSPLCVALDGRVVGLLSFADARRAEAPAVVEAVRRRGIREIVLLTGEHKDVAKRMAHDLAISHYVAGAAPREKAEVVKKLRRDGYTVAVVGYGLNDAPALEHADVGIAVHGGAEITRAMAQLILLQGGLRGIPLALDISRDAVRLITESWRIISIPNTVALGLACLGVLGPIEATLLSDGASILATLNSLGPLSEEPDPRRATARPRDVAAAAQPA